MKLRTYEVECGYGSLIEKLFRGFLSIFKVYLGDRKSVV